MVDYVHGPAELNGFSDMRKRIFRLPESSENPVSGRMAIGRRIKEIRTKRGISQAELGQRIGRAQSTVAEWEREANEPGRDVMGAIAATLGVSIEFLERGDARQPVASVSEALVARLPEDDLKKLDAEDLATAIEMVLRRILAPSSGLHLDHDAIDAAATAAAGAYSALGAITNRRGVARIREALEPALGGLLAAHALPDPDPGLLEHAASVCGETYLVLRGLPADIRSRAP